MWSELLLVPALSGFLIAILLPVLGCYLRIREAWLAALAYAHAAAAGALLATPLGLPALGGGLLGSGLAGLGRRLLADRLGGAAYPVLLLAAWALGVLVTANHPLAEHLGHALFDGQLYFADGSLLSLLAGWTCLLLLLLRRMSRRLLLASLYPAQHRLLGGGQWLLQGGFDLLAALSLALATMTLGVMGAFALVFVPPWLAFRQAANWQAGLRLAAVIGLLSYLLAFAVAFALDQPFGPVLAAALVLLALLWPAPHDGVVSIGKGAAV